MVYLALTSSVHSVGDQEKLESLVVAEPEFTSDSEVYKNANRFDGESYPKEISRRMLTTAFMGAVPCFFGAYYECYVLSVHMWISWLFSINYWRKPIMGNWRRNADIVTTNSCCCLHLIYAFLFTDNVTRITFFFIVVVAFCIYLLSKWAKINGNMHLDSFFHCSLHLWVWWNIWLYRNIYLQNTPNLSY